MAAPDEPRTWELAVAGFAGTVGHEPRHADIGTGLAAAIGSASPDGLR